MASKKTADLSRPSWPQGRSCAASDTVAVIRKPLFVRTRVSAPLNFKVDQEFRRRFESALRRLT